MMYRSSMTRGIQSGTPEGRPFKSLNKMVRSENSSISQARMEPKKVKRIMVLLLSTILVI